MAFVLLVLTTLEAKAELNLDRVIGETRGWTIGFSEGVGACVAAAKFKDGTTVWIGVDSTGDTFLAFSNPGWKSIQPKGKYNLTLRTTRKNWKGNFFGFERAGEKGVYSFGLNPTFVNDLADADGVRVFVEGQLMTRPSLEGSRSALSAIADCQKSNRTKTAEKPPESQGRSTGTGFFISDDGSILPNYHVVRGCSRVAISRAGMTPTIGGVVTTDENNDLALISSNAKVDSIPKFRIGARIGESIFVYGFPLSGVLASSGNFTSGNITATAGMSDDARMLQISAPIQPGNSGGPVLDQFGNVIGVVVAKLNELKIANTLETLPQNVNFAIKSTIAVTFLESRDKTPSTTAATVRLDPAEIADRAKSFTVQIECEIETSKGTAPADDQKACLVAEGDAAIRACSRLISLQDFPKTDRAIALLFRGIAYYSQEDAQKAISDFDQALQLDPNYARAWAWRGIVNGGMDNFDQAISDLSRAIRIDPKLGFAYKRRGDAYDLKGDYDRAIADYNEAILIEPREPETFFARGTTYDHKGDYAKAVADYDEAIRKNPKKPTYFNARGYTYDNMQQYEKAVSDFNEAIRLKPDYVLSARWQHRRLDHRLITRLIRSKPSRRPTGTTNVEQYAKQQADGWETWQLWALDASSRVIEG
jgi:S1-C subfamily serine protease/Flp pilus assembly protein TadD